MENITRRWWQPLISCTSHRFLSFTLYHTVSSLSPALQKVRTRLTPIRDIWQLGAVARFRRVFFSLFCTAMIQLMDQLFDPPYTTPFVFHSFKQQRRAVTRPCPRTLPVNHPLLPVNSQSHANWIISPPVAAERMSFESHHAAGTPVAAVGRWSEGPYYGWPISDVR